MTSALLALAVGCAGDISAAAPGEPSAAADGGRPTQSEVLQPPEPLAPGAWQDLSFDERKQFMRESVMPVMRAVFAEADPERYASFSCASCHGEGTSDGSFAMPSASLPTLGGQPLQTELDDAQEEQRKQRITELMRNRVKPEMAELLGQPELRCSQCHPSAS